MRLAVLAATLLRPGLSWGNPTMTWPDVAIAPFISIDVTVPVAPKKLMHVADEVSGAHSMQFFSPPTLSAKTDIWATCQTEAGASVASVDYDLLLVDN